jgi:hypothetical protein
MDGQQTNFYFIYMKIIYFKCIKNYMKKINTFKCINNFILICTDGRKEGWMDNRQIFILSIYFKCIKNYMKKINTFKCINNFILICTDGRTEGRMDNRQIFILSISKLSILIIDNFFFACLSIHPSFRPSIRKYRHSF